MNITVTVSGTPRTSQILWSSFQIEDNINEKVNKCSFETKKYGDRTWTPEIGDEIEVTDGTDTIFAGLILQVEKTLDGARLQRFKVNAVDWTHYLDRQQVVESYTGMTVEEIISDIITNYTSGFTTTNVDCSIPVSSMTFNYLTVSQCLKKLADAVGYSWYVDYDKDIHFFAKNTELSAFNLTDTNGNYINKSLVLVNDLSQLRNKVRIRGGEIEGDPRTETYDGDGTKKTYPLGNKFTAKPAVVVAGSPYSVGVDFLDLEDDYNCFWNFNEKYIRFRDASIPPSGANNIEITGTPYIPIIVEVYDIPSINTYGVYEFYRRDASIKTTAEAKQYAVAELDAYKASVEEGEFQTYISGLSSGEVINIQSDIRGIDDDFIIQVVRLKMRSYNEGIWTVKIATLKTIGIISVLQKLLLTGQLEIKDLENEVIYKYFTDHQTIQITEDISVQTAQEDYQTVQITELIRKDPWTADWVLGPYFPVDDDDNKRPFRLDITSYLL